MAGERSSAAMAKLDGNSGGGRRLCSISAGFAHGCARGGSEWVDGEAVQLGVRRIEAGRRAVAGATNGGDSARLRSHELDLDPRKEKGWKGGEGSRARERIRAVPRRRGTPG